MERQEASYWSSWLPSPVNCMLDWKRSHKDLLTLSEQKCGWRPKQRALLSQIPPLPQSFGPSGFEMLWETQCSRAAKVGRVVGKGGPPGHRRNPPSSWVEPVLRDSRFSLPPTPTLFPKGIGGPAGGRGGGPPEAAAGKGHGRGQDQEDGRRHPGDGGPEPEALQGASPPFPQEGQKRKAGPQKSPACGLRREATTTTTTTPGPQVTPHWTKDLERRKMLRLRTTTPIIPQAPWAFRMMGAVLLVSFPPPQAFYPVRSNLLRL